MIVKVLNIITGVALMLAIPAWWPYDYYILLRWFVFFSGAYTAYGFYKSNIRAWSYTLGAIVFIFNPIFPIYLSKNTWVIIDLMSGILFFISAHSIKNQNNENN